MDVSVIIVNYKTSQLLMQAIDSILDKTEDIVYEIIVVDNTRRTTPNALSTSVTATG